MVGFDWSIKAWADVAAIATMVGGAGIILAFLALVLRSDGALAPLEHLLVVQYRPLFLRVPPHAPSSIQRPDEGPFSRCAAAR